MTDFIKLSGEVESIAREAGHILREGRSELTKINFLDATDVKLEADLASERYIREALGRISPYAVIGEEEGGDADLVNQYEPYWVVDPLDGTHNYLRGVPQCAISIGLMRGETPVMGVIYDFNADECFTGVVAVGAFLNSIKVEPKWASRRDQAALQTGFPSGMDKSPARLQTFTEKVVAYKKIRMLGSAALGLAYVGVGRYDVYYEETIRLWDVAAGLAIVQAAGGVIRMKPGSSGKKLAYDIWAAGRNDLILEDRL